LILSGASKGVWVSLKIKDKFRLKIIIRKSIYNVLTKEYDVSIIVDVM